MKTDNVLRFLLFFGAVVAGGDVVAQAYPVRPIRMIVPFAPGGP